MSVPLVALFEGDPAGAGLRLVGRTRDPEVVRIVRELLARERRAEAEALEREPAARLRAVPGRGEDGKGPPDAA